jgi:hypothetical protein
VETNQVEQNFQGKTTRQAKLMRISVINKVPDRTDEPQQVQCGELNVAAATNTMLAHNQRAGARATQLQM